MYTRSIAFFFFLFMRLMLLFQPARACFAVLLRLFLCNAHRPWVLDIFEARYA